MKDIKIIVATHKDYQMPEDTMYLPVFVGSHQKESIQNFQRDDQGENISDKNPYFCELTGLYWAWKNLDAEYIGLSHYRRQFTEGKNKKDPFQNILKKETANKLFDEVNIILPKKRNYYIENLYDHYAHTLCIETLDETGKILEEKYPEYMTEFNKLHKRTSAHMFNMFVMKKEYLDQYCTWLFDILFELEKKIDASKYDRFHARFFGRVSELLLDVWINTNNLPYAEVKVSDMEKVDWFKKGTAFLQAKFTGKRYEKSF